jgi:hypothetical protein
MATASKYSSLLPASFSGQDSAPGKTTVSETSPTSAAESGSNSSFTSDVTSNFTPENEKILGTLIAQLMGGGTKQQKKQTRERDAVTELVRNLLGEFSKQKAFEDAKGLMALNMQNSMQKNMPAIQKSIEGAGTSASSMQSLLSQNLVNDSALAASALGAEQAKAYAGTTTNLASLLEALTRSDNSVLTALTNALGLSKGGTVNRSVSQSGTSSANKTMSGSTKTETVNGGYSGGSSSLGQAQAGGTGGGGLSYVSPQLSLDQIVSAAASAGYDGDLRPYYAYE